MNQNPQQHPDDEQKVTRRVFVQYSAAIAASSSVVCAITLKSDALGYQNRPVMLPGDDDGMPYHYMA